MRYLILKFKNKINKDININEIIHDLFNPVKIIIKDETIIIFTHQEKEIIYEILENLITDLLTDIIAYISNQGDENYERIISYFNTDVSHNIILDEKKLLIQMIKEKSDLIFKPEKLKHLSFEMIETAKNFLENNQNITQTASKMYLHRNTLIQRLDKFKKETDYDLKAFEDAFVIYYFIK
ncbi:MAG: hypothetical protein GX312_01075 [Candidatus Phytoplasma sp.]|nr:hypothetical protein [Phytoplasma sp.]